MSSYYQLKHRSAIICVSCGQLHEQNGTHLYDYYQPVDEDMMCHICLQPLVNPIDTKCGHTFCSRCLKNYLKVQCMCPVDRLPLSLKDCQQSSVLVRSKHIQQNMEEEAKQIVFILGDILPTYYDVALSIVQVCTKRQGEKAQITLNAYYAALIRQWTAAFGEGHTLSRKAVMCRLEKVRDSYHNEVYLRCSRKTPKRPNQPIPTIRRQNKVWRDKVINKDGDTNASLFDIGVEMETLEGAERVFYDDQKTVRRFRLSQEVDEEYVKQKEEEWLKDKERMEQEQNELEAMEDDTLDSEYEDMDVSVSFQNQSINRSGLSRYSISTNTTGTQTELYLVSYEPPRANERVCADKCKATCATLSSVAGISVEKSRKALQIVCNQYYGDEVYLTKKEAEEAACSGDEPPSKKMKGDKLKRVIASSKTINNYKHMQASQVERDAGLALLHKSDDVKSTLHYDTTSRCFIDGEWPSIILNFSDGRDFELRPIFFAHENREQIAILLVETLKRLSVAATGSDSSAKQLWENLYAIMTDSVSKNLHIEDLIADSLSSTYKPRHLLCKSHTVEKLDACNLEVLAQFEKKVNQREVLENINPRLKSFFRGKKTTVEAGIEALLNLVSHKSSAKPSSHGETFDFICERENVVKRLFLYQQRRFTKLGKSAASILESYQILQMVVDELKETNQLVEACRIYLASEIYKTELEVLAYFTHHVTFPFLHCVEKSSQEDLLVILPKLHSDLKATKLNTLSKFVVEMRHVPVHKPETELGLKLLDLMCISAADGVMLQCGAEYGLAEESSKRATDLSLLSKEELEGLPTENLKCERNLSVFDNRSGKVAKCRNRRFTGKSIRNDVMLYRNVQGTVDPETKFITKLLDERESIWTNQQKVILKEEIKKKLQKTIDFNVMVKNLLNGCKKWGGPVTSASEILDILRTNPDTAEKILKTEFAYFVHTHLTQKTQRPDLFRQNNISYEDKLGNFCILLSDDVENCSATIANLPTNEDGVRAITSLVSSEPESVSTSSASAYKENDMCAVFWKEREEYVWYLGYITELINNGEKYKVDHLHRFPASQHKYWQYPRRHDSYDILPEQIIDVRIDGDWTLEERNRRFLLSNEKEIIYQFKQIQIC